MAEAEKIEPIEYNCTSNLQALYQCPECRRLHSSDIYMARPKDARASARHAAEICCKQHHCKDCGCKTENFQTICRTCIDRRNLREAAIVEWDGECYVGEGDHYWSTLEEASDSGEPPAYVHPCTFEPLRLDPDRIYDIACDDHHDNMAEFLDGDRHWVDLMKAVEKFNEATDHGSWFYDSSKVIVIDEEKFRALIADQNSAAA